jgi:hypothetical protein
LAATSVSLLKQLAEKERRVGLAQEDEANKED